ncbi:ABC transporter permease [Kaistella sp. G5-32]|uniref:ABC transporter permease n=1 Tax=Kaistella gelatinilytica TaxID=2787636 RepID=A0ABS0F9L6_9FLAO|nr:phosphatase PAP2 family protein [Kaistella gelatinilytica]MBF8456395.1 ABC transporter permease [Kaistella gelatinilytica]
MIKTRDSFITTISKIISNFFNPLTSLFIFFIYRNLQLHTFKETFYLFLPLFLFTAVPIYLWIIWNVKKGKYTNMDVSNRKQRKSLYFVIAGILLTYLLYDYLINQNTDLIIVFILLLLFAMQVSNYFIKSSMHTSFNIFVAALFFAVNPVMGLIWFGIAITVGVTRIILKMHTTKEVLAGAAVAILVSFIYLYANIQIQS